MINIEKAKHFHQFVALGVLLGMVVGMIATAINLEGWAYKMIIGPVIGGLGGGLRFFLQK